MPDKRIYDTIEKMEPIGKGWSEDKKYRVKDFHVEWIGGVPICLKKPFDLNFIYKYGTVFKFIDHGGMGNLCFGVENDGKRYFLKFAGAPKERFSLTKEEAIAVYSTIN